MSRLMTGTRSLHRAPGHLGLWVTNGTAAGTQELTGVAGASTTGLAPSDIIVFNNEVCSTGSTPTAFPACG